MSELTVAFENLLFDGLATADLASRNRWELGECRVNYGWRDEVGEGGGDVWRGLVPR